MRAARRVADHVVAQVDHNNGDMDCDYDCDMDREDTDRGAVGAPVPTARAGVDDGLRAQLGRALVREISPRSRGRARGDDRRSEEVRVRTELTARVAFKSVQNPEKPVDFSRGRRSPCDRMLVT